MTALPLAVENLSVAFKLSGGRKMDVLRGVSFELRPGEVAGLVGEGGSGKSTLIEAGVGLLRDNAIVEGRIEVFGREIARLPLKEQQVMRGVEVGTIASGGRALLNPMARVGAQISNILRDHGVGEAERAARAIELLTEVGIPDPQRRTRAYPHELSGGMAQRIVIAIALAAKPKLILADEPTRGLDVTIAADVLDLLRQLITDGDASALIATRDLGIVAQYCDRIIVLRDGEVVDDLPVADFFPTPPSEYSRQLVIAERSALQAGVRKGCPASDSVTA